MPNVPTWTRRDSAPGSARFPPGAPPRSIGKMTVPERRKAGRQPVDLPGELYLSRGRCIPVRIVNLGGLGALIQVTDLEVAILEGERVVLGHPTEIAPPSADATTRSPGAVVRVDLEFADAGVSRHVAVFFDGGAPPEGCTA